MIERIRMFLRRLFCSHYYVQSRHRLWTTGASHLIYRCAACGQHKAEPNPMRIRGYFDVV